MNLPKDFIKRLSPYFSVLLIVEVIVLHKEINSRIEPRGIGIIKHNRIRVCSHQKPQLKVITLIETVRSAVDPIRHAVSTNNHIFL